MFKFKNYNFKSFSLSIVALVLALGGVGIILIQRLQDEDEIQFEKQVLGYAVGLVVMIIIAMVDYHFICKLAIPLYLINIGLMLFTKYTSAASGLPVYGKNHFQAKRWIAIKIGSGSNGIIEFMPSEFTKVMLIICLAVLFTKFEKHIKKFWMILLAAAVTVIPIYMVFKQPDLSTSIVIFLFFCVMLFASGVNLRYLVPIVSISIPLLFFMIWYVQQDWQILLNEWQQKRVLSLLNPAEYSDAMFQQNNAMLAIKAGGVFGKLLLGDTSPRVTVNVPVVESDFIFAAIGEEFGILGMILIIGAYFVFAVLGVRIAIRAKDNLGRLVAVGITSLMSIQAFVNIGVVTSLLPNTGIPLPFVSSGLTALITNLATLGILLNISLQPSGFYAQEEDNFDYELKRRGSKPNDFSKINL